MLDFFWRPRRQLDRKKAGGVGAFPEALRLPRAARIFAVGLSRSTQSPKARYPTSPRPSWTATAVAWSVWDRDLFSGAPHQVECICLRQPWTHGALNCHCTASTLPDHVVLKSALRPRETARRGQPLSLEMALSFGLTGCRRLEASNRMGGPVVGARPGPRENTCA